MPNLYKTRFEEDGQRCQSDLSRSKQDPLCGAIDRSEFMPANKPLDTGRVDVIKPNIQVEQFRMAGLTGALNRHISKRKSTTTPEFTDTAPHYAAGFDVESRRSPIPRDVVPRHFDATGFQNFYHESRRPYAAVPNKSEYRFTPSTDIEMGEIPTNTRVVPKSSITAVRRATSGRRNTPTGHKNKPSGGTRAEHETLLKRKTTIMSPGKRRSKMVRAPPTNIRARSVNPHVVDEIIASGWKLADSITGQVNNNRNQRYGPIAQMELSDIPLTPETGILPEPVSESSAVTFDESDASRALTFFDTDEMTETRAVLQFDDRLTVMERVTQSIRENRPNSIDVAGGLAGIAAAAGTSIALQNSGVNRFANDGISGAAGDVTGRIWQMAAQRAGQVGARSVLRGIAYGAAEGGLIGAASGLIDAGTEYTLHDMLHTSHSIADSAGAFAGGAAATAAFSLAAAPETLGMSLILGSLLTTAFTIVGATTGAGQDREEREARDKKDRTISMAIQRQKLLATLPSHEYDFDAATLAWIASHSGTGGLALDDESWEPFKALAESLFTEHPRPLVPESVAAASNISEDERRVTMLFHKYVRHELAKDSENTSTDPGELLDEERKFLDDKTAHMWQSQGDVQVEISKQNKQYTIQRVNDAQQDMYDDWNENRRLPSEMDAEVIKTAYIDDTFEARFKSEIKLDAQAIVMDAFYKDQTTLAQMPPNIQMAANMDAEYAAGMTTFYKKMHDEASQIRVTIPQLLELQGIEGEAQASRYRAMQFERVQGDESVVQSAVALSERQDASRVGNFYYDIDQRYLQLRDPTQKWQPSDSQILQAHALGMNLNQYVEYIHELAKGPAGSFEGLPTYTEAELERYGLEDAAHLEDELRLDHRNPRMYAYDPITRRFTRTDVTSDRAMNVEYESPYTPEYLERAREEYSDMIHGLNSRNQAEVDAVNTQLHEQLSIFARNYNQSVSDRNDALMRQDAIPSQLLHFSVEKAYRDITLHYDPFSESLNEAGRPGGVVTSGPAITHSISDIVKQMAQGIANAGSMINAAGRPGGSVTSGEASTHSISDVVKQMAQGIANAGSMINAAEQKDTTLAKAAGLDTAEEYRASIGGSAPAPPNRRRPTIIESDVP